MSKSVAQPLRQSSSLTVPTCQTSRRSNAAALKCHSPKSHSFAKCLKFFWSAVRNKDFSPPQKFLGSTSLDRKPSVRRTVGRRHLAKRQLAKSPLTCRQLTNRYLTDGHLTNKYWTDGHLTYKHLTNRHLTNRLLTNRH
jgi:hypothetical protein